MSKLSPAFTFSEHYHKKYTVRQAIDQASMAARDLGRIIDPSLLKNRIAEKITMVEMSEIVEDLIKRAAWKA